MDELQARHRKEQRDLQSKITQKKKSATKKTRKGVNDDCARFEQELKERQATELASVNVQNGDGDTIESEPTAQEGQVLSVDEGDGTLLEATDGVVKKAISTQVESSERAENPSRKPNRQKARLARRAAEQEAVAAQAAEEAANMPDERERERTHMLSLFEERGLKEHEIRADGHCLYSAVADQMQQLGVGLAPSKPVSEDPSTNTKNLPGYLQVRRAAAEYITANSDDFAAFLEEPLDEYVHKVRDTGEWGGQLELTALANAYELEINVLQGNGRVEKITSQPDPHDRKIWLAYYRHGFGLGEHYNSLRKDP